MTRKHFGMYVLLALLGVALFVWYAVFAESGEYLTVAFLDVGQGDAIFIETKQGTQMLIDGGPNKKVLSELGEVMPFYDRTIDVVVATHPDQDHIGGLVSVLERYDVAMVLESGMAHDSGVYEEWIRARDSENANVVTARRGMRLRLDAQTFFDILLPYDIARAGNPNDASIVGKFVHGDTCFLFTGDAERNAEVKLLGDDIACDVLKIGHHGSKTSTSDAFLRTVSPAIAVISAGKDNRFGHPHDVIVNKLQESFIRIFRTDIDRTIILRSNGSEVFLQRK